MAARQSAAPAVPSGDKAYDPEIQDMASYVHQYNVDSDLAVSFRVTPCACRAEWNVPIC